MAHMCYSLLYTQLRQDKLLLKPHQLYTHKSYKTGEKCFIWDTKPTWIENLAYNRC